MNGSQAHLDTRAIEFATEARQIAKDARDQCRQEYEGLWSDLRRHQEETNRRFDRQDEDHRIMHAEHQKKLDECTGKIDGLSRTIHRAVGGGIVIAAIWAAIAPFLLPKLMQTVFGGS